MLRWLPVGEQSGCHEGELDSVIASRLEHMLREGAVARSVEARPGVAVGSLKGPRADNQDRAAVAHIRGSQSSGDLLVAVVCDGMGGMDDGGPAATTAMSAFVAALAENQGPIAERLRDAIELANHRVHARWGGAGGTTLTAVVANSAGAAWGVHAGDSRIYSFTLGEGPELLSQDDTVQGLVRAHDPIGDEDELDNRLLQFVGIGEGFSPHIYRLDGGRERMWFVTSDGAHALGRKLLHSVTQNARSVGDLVRKLVFVVEAAPMGDNASVAAISPAEFTSHAPFTGGLNLTVWTPNDRLELWVAQNVARASESPQAKAATKPPKRNSTRRARPKTQKEPAPPTDPALEPVKPQLNIVFSDPDDK